MEENRQLLLLLLEEMGVKASRLRPKIEIENHCRL